MKRTSRFVRGAAAAILLAGLATGAQAATETDKQDAIDAGLAWLSGNQQGSGFWAYGGYHQAATGAAISAFVSQSGSWGANAPAYQAQVSNAVNALLQQATITTVSTRGDGLNICPGGGSCSSVYWGGGGETTYTTGLVSPALAQYALQFGGGPNAVATTTGPLAGMTWKQIAQAVDNTWAAGQTTNAGSLRGGWRYFPGNQDSDMSTTQWAAISMIYNQTLGASVPAQTRSDLAQFLANVQAPSGAGCYQPGNGLCNHADTGGMLLGLSFLGGLASDPAVQAALAWLNTHWTEGANATWYGNFGHPYAMWSVYKGLETLIGLDDTGTISNLLTSCGAPGNLPGNPPGSTPCNWWQDYNEYLVNSQNPDGSWNGYAYWYGPLATAFNVSILGATEIPVPPAVPEPASLLLFGAALLGLGVVRGRRAA